MNIYNVRDCCSANILTGLNFLKVEEVQNAIQSAYDDGQKMLLAITADDQKKAERVLKTCGFKKSKAMNNPYLKNSSWITLWYRNTKPEKKKKKGTKR